MAALRTAKQVLRRELKLRVAALTDEERLRQSHLLSQEVRDSFNMNMSFRETISRFWACC